MKFFTTSLVLLASAGLSFANSIPSLSVPALPASIPTDNPITLISELSPQCQAALFGIVASPEFLECVPVLQLLPVLTDPTLLPSVIKDPLANAAKLLPAVDAICKAPKCKDKDVSAALQSVLTNCAGDAKNPIIQLTTAVLTFYSPVRDILCFENNKGLYCTIDTATQILTLPSPPPEAKLLGGFIDKLIFAEPKSICTPCNKAILNTLLDFLVANPQVLPIIENTFHIGNEEFFIGKLFFSLKCGFEFLDGKVPDPSKIDPKKFVYQQVADSDDKKSLAIHNDMNNIFVLGSLLASTLMLN